ncbi:eukaryotic translation initiation factor 2D [Callorhinchus milii]|uniref:Eukaryotic translation initiation factor 2D n=1 Tax=Callorhinchus milii TaxID=7868 RepID=A0A4W3H497_CALMI|nr:eukaryotic translation initiation factor 2D [Callorhinchus milii]|eukprot:gi/632963179/ref/XP_007897737.1/ PREDICTED: eukaryotic translation initiation factor 2D [Callorhinchus milii]
MFVKPFRVKSNTVIKGSDRRKLKAQVVSLFPSLSGHQLSQLVPNKEELNVVKINSHKGDAVTVFVLNRNPIFFEVEKRLYPTVYTLWSYPDLMAAVTTWPAVLEKLAGGADLMLPGVVVPPSGLPDILQGDLCAVNLVGSRAPIAVGLACMTTAQMVAARMKGKGISVFHTYHDQLWAFGERSSPPLIAHKFCDLGESGDQLEVEEEEERELSLNGINSGNEEAPRDLMEGDIPDVTEDDVPDVHKLCLNAETESEGLNSGTDRVGDCETCAIDPDGATDNATVHQENTEDTGATQEQMDELLLQCFLHALKFKVKKEDLPLLTSTFLRNRMYPCCPEGRQLDIKKSSYKKLSKFLQSMQQRQMLKVDELSKGVEGIVSVNWKHVDLKSFCVPETCTTEDAAKVDDGDSESVYQPPEFNFYYTIPSKLFPLFEHAGLKRGATLTHEDIRSIVINYVKSNELMDDCNKNYVIINPVLCDCLLEKSEYHTVTKLKWDDFFARCFKRLDQCHEVVFPGQRPIIRKGSIEPIDINIDRASNKKVTVVKNLELFGLDLQMVKIALQRRAQATVAVKQTHGKDKWILWAQGNQIAHVGKLLLEEYRIPQKYIKGLEKAPKKK